jgi:hypothetical protein
VHKDKLVVRFKSDRANEGSDCSNDRSLTIGWQKPPSPTRLRPRTRYESACNPGLRGRRSQPKDWVVETIGLELVMETGWWRQ